MNGRFPGLAARVAVPCWQGGRQFRAAWPRADVTLTGGRF